MGHRGLFRPDRRGQLADGGRRRARCAERERGSHCSGADGLITTRLAICGGDRGDSSGVVERVLSKHRLGHGAALHEPLVPKDTVEKGAGQTQAPGQHAVGRPELL